ncbi:hypothetical protein [Sulfuricurvum sp.]|uniref:hypothetical protein n=1 Tax=Sulfuricurvum sp. TaxID=2025608 RepID=UPI0026174A14|nr:hypothetical protein [Sulfuricurvum sp.]MDD2267469.1 hypothetical protein [Sulfuricurvum sp.]
MKLEPMRGRDIDEVEAILKPITGDLKIRRRIKEHLRIGLCRIIRDDENIICALALAGSDGVNVSLTNYWVREDKRKTLVSLWLFSAVFPYFKGKNVYIKSDDISTFSAYVEPTRKKNEYRFIGTGKNIDFEKLNRIIKEHAWVK